MTFSRVATQLTPSQGHSWSSFFQCWFQHLLGGLLGSFLLVFPLICGYNSTFCLVNHFCNSLWITSSQQLVSVYLVPSNKTTSYNIGSRTWLPTPLTPRYYHGYSKPSFWIYLAQNTVRDTYFFLFSSSGCLILFLEQDLLTKDLKIQLTVTNLLPTRDLLPL